ncbi:MAG: hypothetical protein IK051_00150 [Rhodocyclaceae bacterium]|nr:hypothetical protein [Rhodocyclaceae bacterium]
MAATETTPGEKFLPASPIGAEGQMRRFVANIFGSGCEMARLFAQGIDFLFFVTHTCALNGSRNCACVFYFLFVKELQDDAS